MSQIATKLRLVSGRLAYGRLPMDESIVAYEKVRSGGLVAMSGNGGQGVVTTASAYASLRNY